MTTYKKTGDYSYHLYTAGYINHPDTISHALVDGTFYPLETVDLTGISNSSIEIIIPQLPNQQIETVDIIESSSGNIGVANPYWQLANNTLSVGYMYSGSDLTPDNPFGIKMNYFVFLH